MDKLIPALVVAALTGITVVAYQHPTAYNRIGIYLVLATGALQIGLSVWNLGLIAARMRLLPFIKDLAGTGLDEADKALEPIRVPGWVLASVLLAMLYLLFLAFLPILLSE